MRIWDQVPPANLCDQHLLAQWREGLGLWSILTNPAKTGYRNHPETKRWVESRGALVHLLIDTRTAMRSRGWAPKPLPDTCRDWLGRFKPTTPGGILPAMPAPWDDQLSTLRAKGCACKVPQEITA